jgi:aspartate-semialdehyde dehydrogenase
MKNYNVVILGATGAVGIEFRKILQQRNFPINNIRFLGKTTVGNEIDFDGRKVKVEAVSADAFKGFDIALFSAGASISREVARQAAEAGCVVIDNSSAWRMEPDIPLVVPEVNPDDVDWHKGIIANPNCSTIQMVVALKPIHDAAKIKRIVVSTYQAVSGTGLKAIEECLVQTETSSTAGRSHSAKCIHPDRLQRASPDRCVLEKRLHKRGNEDGQRDQKDHG